MTNDTGLTVQLRVALVGGKGANHKGLLAEWHRIGEPVDTISKPMAAYGVTFEGSINALSAAVRRAGGVVYQNGIAANEAAVVLPVELNITSLGMVINNDAGEVVVTSSRSYSPPV